MKHKIERKINELQMHRVILCVIIEKYDHEGSIFLVSTVIIKLGTHVIETEKKRERKRARNREEKI